MRSADWTSPQRSPLPFARHLAIAVGAAGAVAAATFCGSGDYRSALSITIFAPGLAVLLTSRPSFKTLLLVWFITTPTASFFLYLPTNDPIITYDRAIFGIVGLMLLLSRLRAAGVPATPTHDSQETTKREDGVIPARRPERPATPIYGFETAWILLCAIALASVALQSASLGYGMRIAVDTFCLPLIAFHAARTYPDGRGVREALLLGAAALALFLFSCGAFEFLTNTDLFAFEGAQLVRESEIRVNGPFNSDSSYAVICGMLAIFLRAAPQIFPVSLDRGARVVYWSAFACALAAALLPLYRVVGVALVVSWIIVEVGLSGGRSRAAGRTRLRIAFSTRALAGAAILLIAAGTAGLLLQTSQARLASARNLYSRLATWEAAATIAFEQPLFGVGLTNYNQHFNQRYSRADQWRAALMDARPMAYPHSNSLWIAAELGVAAFVVYLIANIYLFLVGYTGWRQAQTSRQKAAAGCFLAILAAYSIPGLSLTSGGYSDLNLYFLFFLGLISRLFAERQSNPV